ncbi:MAG: 30S ribosomal protein S6 [Thermodesulfobacteriota bacterium]
MIKPRRYETLVLLSPDLAEEEHEQAKKKLTDIIEKMSGRLVRLEDWGRRRLAYPVRKQMYGVYVLMDYMGTPELLGELERNMRIDERVWKHMSLILDKNFTDEKYQTELDRLSAEAARREAEKAQREAERARREAESEAEAQEGPAGEDRGFGADEEDLGPSSGQYPDEDEFEADEEEDEE